MTTTLRKKLILLTIVAICVVVVLIIADAVRADTFDTWAKWAEQDKQRELEEQQRQRIVYVYPKRPPIQPNGTYYTDEQLRQSNMTRYNASGKQQVSRHIESWRSPLQRFDGDERPGVYASGYLGPLPNGPIGGPYCPPGYDCFRFERNYRRGGYEHFAP